MLHTTVHDAATANFVEAANRQLSRLGGRKQDAAACAKGLFKVRRAHASALSLHVLAFVTLSLYSTADMHPLIQAGAYAEFRVDWPEALRQYELAYRQLLRAAASAVDAPAPLQLFFEILAVAEVLSIKVRVLHNKAMFSPACSYLCRSPRCCCT